MKPKGDKKLPLELKSLGIINDDIIKYGEENNDKNKEILIERIR